MKDFIAQLQAHKHKEVTLIFYHKREGVIQQLADATYTLLLADVQKESVMTITLTNGEDGAGKSVLSIKIPLTATILELSPTEWHCEYEEGQRTTVVKFLFPKKIAPPSFQKEIVKETIKEVRSPEGKLERIYVDSPEAGANIAYLEKVKTVLEQLLLSWQIVQLQTDNDGIEYNGAPLTFDSVDLVSIPGNTFFEIHFSNETGEKILEMGTTFAIDLKAHKLTFELDAYTYTLTKSS